MLKVEGKPKRKIFKWVWALTEMGRNVNSGILNMFIL